MRVAVVILALAALANAADTTAEELLSSFGSLQTQYENKPVVVVRKTTYYEPELVAVVVEKGVDNIPEDAYLIQNYADVLSPANSAVVLCSKSEEGKCLDTPVTKLLVPNLFQSIGHTGFENFFQQAKEIPWVSTMNNNIEAYNPLLVPKATPVAPVVSPYTNVQTLTPVSPDVFRVVSEASPIPSYQSVFSEASSLPAFNSPSLPAYEAPQPQYISQSSPVFPSNLHAGFAPLDQGIASLFTPKTRTSPIASTLFTSYPTVRTRRGLFDS